ncbi:hypothetical protein IV498_08165 [Paenarthrobacter sp. Z7-10]|nr:hypothetical protein [Paenarthrobacter sp. Z7-10]
MATAVAKYWVCKRGPGHAYEAMECLGGNGYTEAFPLALRYREQPVLAIWEGAGNVVALDVLRAMATEPESVDAFMSELRLAQGVNVVFDGYLGALEQQLMAVMQRPGDFGASARTLVAMLALAFQASLLIRWSPFCVRTRTTFTVVFDAPAGAAILPVPCEPACSAWFNPAPRVADRPPDRVKFKIVP